MFSVCTRLLHLFARCCLALAKQNTVSFRIWNWCASENSTQMSHRWLLSWKVWKSWIQNSGLHHLSDVHNLVGWSKVEALYCFAGITGELLEGLTTLFRCWREVFLSPRYHGKQGVVLRLKEEVFIWPLSMISLSVITRRHSFSYPFISHGCWGCIHQSLSCQMVHQVQNRTVAGFLGPRNSRRWDAQVPEVRSLWGSQMEVIEPKMGQRARIRDQE